MIDLSNIFEGEDGLVSEATKRNGEGPRVTIDAENAAAGLGRLAVAIVNLLHELLERQAIRRMDNGTLTDQEIEGLGECLMKQSEAIDTLCEAFGISRAELSLDLGPLGKMF